MSLWVSALAGRDLVVLHLQFFFFFFPDSVLFITVQIHKVLMK